MRRSSLQHSGGAHAAGTEKETEMKLKTLGLAAVTTVLATVASANPNCALTNTCAQVPEISALEGTAAIAMVLAVVAIAWERSRRA